MRVSLHELNNAARATHVAARLQLALNKIGEERHKMKSRTLMVLLILIMV